MTKRSIVYACYRRQFGPRGGEYLFHLNIRNVINIYFLVGRGLGTTSSLNLDTPPSSPSLNRMEINLNGELMNTDDIVINEKHQ